MIFAAVTPDPHPLFILPFAALLIAIATLPLLTPHFWHRHYPKLCIALGAISIGYYLGILRAPHRVLHTAEEYAGFIILLAALFTIAGGIHLRVKGEATPLRNVLFLAIGAVLANLIGTTGAAMLLIRPWIRSNKYRFTGFHAAFFIFTIANVGGSLTPIGDPPLFLGYLKGVPFFWIGAHAWPAWLFTLGCILAVFYLLDRRNFLRAPAPIRDADTEHETSRFTGLRNLAWLALLLGAVFIKTPHGLRELLMIIAAVGSYYTTPRPIHESNHFTFAPIVEVAWLFGGLFATMIPALDYLQHHAATLGLSSPAHFYYATGTLSALLDNAPTYLAFLVTALAQRGLSLDTPADLATYLTAHPVELLAISLGSVFFGALTYLGNGPNLMVKAICEHARVHTPSFIGYALRYALPVLLPIYALVCWLFLK